jgi:hypothetical protein
MSSSYSNTGIISDEDHNARHSALLNSNVSFPQSFIFSPVHDIPGDYDSPIVAFLSGGFAWDYALRFLLPSNVEGVVVEIKNSCNQTSVYELMGYDALYLGKDATHESKYDDMVVIRDLSISTHPNFTTTPGHCRYTIVSKLVL